MDQLRNKSTSSILSLYTAVIRELRNREVLRSENVPTGDLAEYLFCKAFHWEQARNSVKAYDATGIDGQRYQIKGRRITAKNKSRQLSSIRDFEGFDVLAVVLFDEEFGVWKAALIPSYMVRELSKYVRHTNSFRFMASDPNLRLNGVTDVTAKLAEALANE